MKKTVLLLVAMFMAMTSFAQMANLKNTITPGEGEEWWGYFTEADANASNFGAYGVNSLANYEAAIKIAKNDPIMGQSTVKAVRIWLNQNTLPKITGLKIWKNKQLKVNATGVSYYQDVDITTLQSGANDIMLDTPFEINDSVMYIGFTMTLSAQDTPIMCGGDYEPNTFFFRATAVTTSWQSINNHGKLAFQVLAEGVNMPMNCAVTSTNFGTQAATIGEELVLPMTIKNKGKNNITSIAYTITTNDDPATTTPEVVVPIDNIAINENATFDVAFDTSEALRGTKTVTITKVNGEPNEAASNQCVASGNFVILAEIFTKVPVVEEFTGTWCGWCPRGFVAMETARETYGDQVVLIAAHNGDPMEISDYNPMMALVGGFPSSFVNREATVDPHPTNILNAIKQDLQNVPIGKIDITAKWNDEEMKTIDVNAVSKFAFAETGANYGVALVLTEDGMSGTGSNWRQSNYYSGQSGDPYMTWWYSQGSYVSGLTFNFVAVGAWELKNGFNGSVATSFEAGEEMPFNYVADITTKNRIQDKANLKMVALLIDRKTGAIVNAAHTTIAPYGTAVVPGDVDGDGVVTAGDITLLYNVLLSGDNTNVVNGDQDGDGQITSSDITSIYNILLGQ